MKKKILLAAALMVALLVGGFSWQPASFAAEIKTAPLQDAIQIDVPVRLEKANVVFNMDRRAFTGDMPVGMKYMHLLAKRFKQMGTQGQIVAVFHGQAAYMTLNDRAYNAYRKVSTGNPYKKRIAELIMQGVQIEECVVSMKGHNWNNKDLLPGIKVNSGAVARLIQLIQAGYVQMRP